MVKEINKKLAIGLIVLFAILVFIPVAVKYDLLNYEELISKLPKISLPKLPKFPWTSKVEGIAKFSSEEEFKEYLQNSSTELQYWAGGMGGGLALEMMKSEFPTTPPATNGETAAPDRVSETNVQVAGIDEPDIVKTDGNEIYLSQEYSYWRGPIILEEKIVSPYPSQAKQML